jgi:hypothetical protein
MGTDEGSTGGGATDEGSTGGGATGETGVDDSGTAGGSETGVLPTLACEEYCTVWFENCTGWSGDNYDNELDCLTQCALIPEGMDGDMSGDTVYCRIYHAGMGDDDNNDHCGHGHANSLDGFCS